MTKSRAAEWLDLAIAVTPPLNTITTPWLFKNDSITLLLRSIAPKNHSKPTATATATLTSTSNATATATASLAIDTRYGDHGPVRRAVSGR